MAAVISYGIGYTANSAAATSLVIQPPPVYAAGNLLVMGVIAAGPSAGVAASTPAGWTALSAGGATLALFWKTAGSSETAVTVTLAASAVAAGFIAAYPASTQNSNSFGNSGSGHVSYTATFPGGVTSGQTVLMLAGSVAGSVNAFTLGNVIFDNASQNVNLPAGWATDVPVFGPVNGSNIPADNNNSLPVAIGLAEITGSTSNPVLTAPISGTIYAGFLVLTVTGSPPSPYTVTAASTAPPGTVGMALTVKALTGTATYTQILAGAAKAAFYAGGVSQAPEVTITPAFTGSAVYGALTENQGVTGGSTFTAAAGTSFSQNVADTLNSAIYGTLQSSSTTTASTPVTLGGTGPANAQTVGVLAEIPAASGQTIAEAATAVVAATQPGQYPTTAASQTAVFTTAPAANTLLVAMVSANSASALESASVTITDSLGLTWRLLAAVASPAYAGIFIAAGPPAATLAAALTVNAAPAGYTPGEVVLPAQLSVSSGSVLGAGAVLAAGFALSSAPAAWLYGGPVPVTYPQYLQQPGGTLAVEPGEIVLTMGPASGWVYGLTTPPPDGRWTSLGGGGNLLATVRGPAPLRSRAARHGDRSRSAYGTAGAKRAENGA